MCRQTHFTSFYTIIFAKQTKKMLTTTKLLTESTLTLSISLAQSRSANSDRPQCHYYRLYLSVNTIDQLGLPRGQHSFINFLFDNALNKWVMYKSDEASDNHIKISYSNKTYYITNRQAIVNLHNHFSSTTPKLAFKYKVQLTPSSIKYNEDADKFFILSLTDSEINLDSMMSFDNIKAEIKKFIVAHSIDKTKYCPESLDQIKTAEQMLTLANRA